MERARRTSKKIFGALYRLEIMAAISTGDVITLTDFVRRFAPTPGQSSIAKELQTLEEAGLLERQPSVTGMRSVYLKSVDSPLWDTARSLIYWSELVPTGVHASSRTPDFNPGKPELLNNPAVTPSPGQQHTQNIEGGRR